MDRTTPTLELSTDLIAEFEHEWISAWNAHDISRIMTHYRHDVQFISPLATRTGAPHGTLHGRTALQTYFKHGLTTYPTLHFQPIAALGGVTSIALHYHAVENRQAIEVMELDPHRHIHRATVHYTATPTQLHRSANTALRSATPSERHRNGDAQSKGSDLLDVLPRMHDPR